MVENFLRKSLRWKKCGKLQKLEKSFHILCEKNVCFMKRKKKGLKNLKRETYPVKVYLLYFTAQNLAVSHIPEGQ